MKTLILGLVVALSSTFLVPGLTAADQHAGQLVDMEKALWEAWKNGDSAAFQQHLAEDAVLILGDGSIQDKAQALEMIGSGECQVASYELADFKFRSLGENAVSLLYLASQDAVCGGEQIPPKLIVGSTWIMKDGRWLNAHYQETVVHEHE